MSKENRIFSNPYKLANEHICSLANWLIIFIFALLLLRCF